MDLEEIRTCCESLEQDITALRMTERIEFDFYSAMIDAVQTISAEISAPPKSNGDRIRQMTDEELADFFCRISECCGNDACMLCPIFEGCAQNVMCVERWLKKEVRSDAKTD